MLARCGEGEIRSRVASLQLGARDPDSRLTVLGSHAPSFESPTQAAHAAYSSPSARSPCSLAAERGRFELPRSLRPWHFSKVLHSTTLPPLREEYLTIFCEFIKKMIPYQARSDIWPYRLTARTRPFQGCNRGSIPRRVTNWFSSSVFSKDSLKIQDNLGVPLTISVYVGIFSNTSSNRPR